MKTVIAGALGECVHVAGVSKFLRLAGQAGWKTVFLGPAVPPNKMLDTVRQVCAETNGDQVLVGVSYRLTPETGERLLGQFAEEASELYENGVKFVYSQARVRVLTRVTGMPRVNWAAALRNAARRWSTAAVA